MGTDISEQAALDSSCFHPEEFGTLDSLERHRLILYMLGARVYPDIHLSKVDLLDGYPTILGSRRLRIYPSPTLLGLVQKALVPASDEFGNLEQAYLYLQVSVPLCARTLRVVANWPKLCHTGTKVCQILFLFLMLVSNTVC